MEVSKKELQAIWQAVTNARNTLCTLAWENYPFGDFEDKELERIFYDLNSICIKLTGKIDRLEQKEASQ